MATASIASQNLGSSILDATSGEATNYTLPFPLRALRFTVNTERLLLRKVPGLFFRLSGLQTLVYVLSDALGMPAPLARATGVNGAEGMAAVVGPQTWKSALLEALEMGNIRSLGGMFNFLFSRWAFACLAMVQKTQLLTENPLKMC